MAETCAEILTRLNAAKAAFEAVMTGGTVRSVTDTDGSRIEYNAANTTNLRNYIAYLQSLYDACIAGTSPAIVTKPVNFFFP